MRAALEVAQISPHRYQYPYGTYQVTPPHPVQTMVTRPSGSLGSLGQSLAPPSTSGAKKIYLRVSISDG